MGSLLKSWGRVGGNATATQTTSVQLYTGGVSNGRPRGYQLLFVGIALVVAFLCILL